MYKKVSPQAQMLKEIMSHEFTAVDLSLYLNTHPNDMKALGEYNHATRLLTTLKCAYEQCYGPLAVFGFTPSQYPWRWIDEPWPWQIEY
ncbi:MAG: spore coat protein CotJB [Eubacteriales bacterium]